MCAANQAAKVYLLNRSEEKAQSVACEVNQALETDCVTAMPLSGYQELAKAGERRYLVIQSTSVGLSPNDDDVIIIPQEEKSAGNQTDDVIIDFGDTPTEEDPQSGKQKKDAYELEDEYYDLDGF